MYLTDVVDVASMGKIDSMGVPEQYIREQRERMLPLLQVAMEMEVMHRELLPMIPFSYAFLRYLDYVIYVNTTGTKQ